MDVPGISTNGIKLMQDAIRKRLAEEDAQSPNQEKVYGVREHPDFKELADEFEAELSKRDVPYEKIVW